MGLARLQLAEALDRAGEHEAAQQEYQRFSGVWQAADASLKRLASPATP